MGWESHHSRSTQPRHLGQHSANLSPATPMCLLSSTDSDLFLSAQGTGFNRPYALNNYNSSASVVVYLVTDARRDYARRHRTRLSKSKLLLSRCTFGAAGLAWFP